MPFNISTIGALIFSATCVVTAHANGLEHFVGRIDLPGVPLKSFDIGFATGGLYALADRSNASVDLVNTRNHRFVARLGGFEGAQSDDRGGPNGVLLIDGHQVWAGDGNSSAKIIDIAAHTVTSVSTEGVKRVDELAYDPRDHLVIAANNADEPPFVTLISSRPPYAVRSKITLPMASDGIEQPVWDARSGMVYVAIPKLDNKPADGGVAVLDPRQGRLVRMDHVSKCMPAGLAVGPGNQLLVGCSDDAVSAGFPARTLLLNVDTDEVSRTFGQVGGSDEIWYDPASGHYVLAAVGNPGGPVVGIIDARRVRWIGNVPTGKGAHSIASENGTIFVPVGAGSANCPRGCIEVFGH
ncbi:YncE family protein [Paraburkholderia sp. B3]|uniref:YncE family protein n=1 Tax=Paraburkholderia sp. B3 TaxID=3134791 RepID=UPI0039825034